MGGGQQHRKFYQAAVDRLVVFAEHQFRLDRKRDDGASERDHLASAQRQIANLPGWKGKKEVVPESPEFPIEIDYVWGWFCELSTGLSSNGMGPAVVTWESLSAWCLMTGTTLDGWEAKALVRIGFARAAIESEKAEKKAKENKPRPKPSPPGRRR